MTEKQSLGQSMGNIRIKTTQGIWETIDRARLRHTIAWASTEHREIIDSELIIEEALKNAYDGISPLEIGEALVLGAVALIERDPAYGYVAARLLFKQLYKEVTSISVLRSNIESSYSATFVEYIQKAVAHEIFDPRLLEFDLSWLSLQLVPDRDNLFDYMGLRTLYERYFAKINNKRIELPQTFFMRIAMGLALNEPEKDNRAAEFYHLMSQMYYMPSTPTLLHAALTRPQLSSCFLATVEDDLHHIFKAYSDNAQLSKWSGGVANDWSNVRATGAWIKTIKTESQGVIPFIKINSDVTASINRSGKRRAATVVYLETWHYDIEDFFDLRRNTGDERRRAHDLNTANWVPDLFMKRVELDGQWTLFSPDEVPDLHHLYGTAFEKKYVEYEQKASQGHIKLFRITSAKQLWRKMLARLFETGHPWITFKDACNIRSPQDHAGVVHSSNLCTEITLNTSADEIAVCNLGSINLARHVIDGKLDTHLLGRSISVAIRMLDNVIDINYYPVKETSTSNMRHRPIGLGLMGFQDALYKLDISFQDEQARVFADDTMEFIAYHAILSSSKLAQERGSYGSYKGSKWDRGIFPLDTIDLLEKERGEPITIDRTKKLDWNLVYSHVKKHGMRNSNVMAIAPTATISNIVGCIPCIEPIYRNLYVKANMSGEFTVINKYLVQDLKDHGLWNQEMLNLIKYYDGNIARIEKIPVRIRTKYKEAFEIDPLWLIKITAARMKWIDQSQSHNVFMQGVSGKLLNDIYMSAWKHGLKTTYYLRTLGASQIEKSTLDAKEFGFTQKRDGQTLHSENLSNTYLPGGMQASSKSEQSILNEGRSKNGAEQPMTGRSCSITDTDCEACQ